MTKSEIQKHKGRLSIIHYKRNDGTINIQSGEITAVTREHTVIAINKTTPEIFKKNEQIIKIVSDKKSMQKYKDENTLSNNL
jgi:hypothetical protein